MQCNMLVLLLLMLLLMGLLYVGTYPSQKKFLDKSRQQVVLGERVNLSHDTVRFRFKLPSSAPVLRPV